MEGRFTPRRGILQREVTNSGQSGTSRAPAVTKRVQYGEASPTIAPMDAPTDRRLPHSPQWWRAFEIGFWIVQALVNTLANAAIVLLEHSRAGDPLPAWRPLVWEASSNGMLLLLVPALVWFTRRFPLHWDTWRRHLPWYAVASVVFSLVHVVGMVALRQLAYATQGATYDFGHWPTELFYEYLKDVRSFGLFVALIEGYRLLRRRLQGEARMLGRPDEGPPVEPVERPERFLVRKLGREFLVAAAEIEWLQASGNYVNLRVRGHDYPLRSTLGSIESRLDPARFVRIHRSYMVNFDQIASIEPLESGDARVHLRDKTVLPCSRTYREALRSRLETKD